MKELDPLVFWAVFQEMLGAPLLWLMLVVILAGTAAFFALLLKERKIDSRRLVRAEFVGVAGGCLALVLMAGLRERLSLAEVPDVSQGAALSLMLAGMLALAFMGFSGLGA